MTPTAVLPVSLVLATLRDQYVEGLTAFRHGQNPWSEQTTRGVRAWLELFIDAADVAAQESASLLARIDELRAEWGERVATYRGERGLRETPRADSATARLLQVLPEAPVLTATSVRRILGVSFPAASGALEELREADVVRTRKIERNTTTYLAVEVLDLVTLTERRLASTQFDTREVQPVRPVPAAPESSDTESDDRHATPHPGPGGA